MQSQGVAPKQKPRQQQERSERSQRPGRSMSRTRGQGRAKRLHRSFLGQRCSEEPEGARPGAVGVAHAFRLQTLPESPPSPSGHHSGPDRACGSDPQAQKRARRTDRTLTPCTPQTAEARRRACALKSGRLPAGRRRGRGAERRKSGGHAEARGRGQRVGGAEVEPWARRYWARRGRGKGRAV